MALFDMKKISKSLQGAADAVSSAAKDIKVPDIKVPDIKVTDIKLPDPASIFAANKEDEKPGDGTSTGISASDALRLFYYLMAADGELSEDELELFYGLSAEFDLESEGYVAQVVSECEAELLRHPSSISPLISAMTCADGVLFQLQRLEEGETPVVPRLVIWNLLAIALADGSYGDAEREYITHINTHFGVDEVILSEMEGSVLATLDLDREIAWIKTTNDSYLAIEQTVIELERRKAAVVEGIQSLIAL